MSETAEKLKIELAGLATEERAELLDFLIETLDDEANGADGAEADLASELARRSEEIHSGKAVGIPAEQVFQELRERYS